MISTAIRYLSRQNAPRLFAPPLANMPYSRHSLYLWCWGYTMAFNHRLLLQIRDALLPLVFISRVGLKYCSYITSKETILVVYVNPEQEAGFK
jgi:hypothetical protein